MVGCRNRNPETLVRIQFAQVGSILQVARLDYGSVAQLGERLNGIEKVEGSNPFRSTKISI